MSNSLVLKHNFNPVLIGLGFFPAMIKKDLIAVADTKNNRELHFKTESREFTTYSPDQFRGNIPSKIKEVISKDNEWFDEFEIVAPERTVDPFLFGVKDGKRYFISCWDTDEWESE